MQVRCACAATEVDDSLLHTFFNVTRLISPDTTLMVDRCWFFFMADTDADILEGRVADGQFNADIFIIYIYFFT